MEPFGVMRTNIGIRKEPFNNSNAQAVGLIGFADNFVGAM
jgi:hypothetical protein